MIAISTMKFHFTKSNPTVTTLHLLAFRTTKILSCRTRFYFLLAKDFLVYFWDDVLKKLFYYNTGTKIDAFLYQSVSLVVYVYKVSSKTYCISINSCKKHISIVFSTTNGGSETLISQSQIGIEIRFNHSELACLWRCNLKPT